MCRGFAYESPKKSKSGNYTISNEINFLDNKFTPSKTRITTGDSVHLLSTLAPNIKLGSISETSKNNPLKNSDLATLSSMRKNLYDVIS